MGRTHSQCLFPDAHTCVHTYTNTCQKTTERKPKSDLVRKAFNPHFPEAELGVQGQCGLQSEFKTGLGESKSKMESGAMTQWIKSFALGRGEGSAVKSACCSSGRSKFSFYPHGSHNPLKPSSRGARGFSWPPQPQGHT